MTSEEVQFHGFRRVLVPMALTIMAVAVAAVFFSVIAADQSDAANGTLDGGVQWSTVGDTLTLTGPSTGANMPDYTDTARPPWPTDGIKKVVIGTGVLYVGTYTFMDCNGLEHVSLGNDLTGIGDGAFDGCASVKRIDVNSKKLANVGSAAVSGLTGLTQVSFSNNVELIPAVARYGAGIETITIPSGAQDFAPYAFDGVTGLKKLVFKPISMDRINAEEVFSDKAVFDVEFAKGIKVIPRSLFANCRSMTELTIPDTVTTICEYAFESCAISSMVLPEGVTTVMIGAFYGCALMKTLTIPSTVTSLEDDCFSECSGLTSVTYNGKIMSECGDHILACYESKAVGFTMYCGEGSIIPSGFFMGADVTDLVFDGTRICSQAFGEWDGTILKRIVFGDNVTTIAGDSFGSFKFMDEKGGKLSVNADNMRGYSYTLSDFETFEREIYDLEEDGSEALKTPAMGMAVFIAVIAAVLIVSFARKG